MAKRELYSDHGDSYGTAFSWKGGRDVLGVIFHDYRVKRK